MSFGASGSLRFDLGHDKPRIFWESTEGLPKSNKKRFSYKKKEMKYPLRRPPQAETEAEARKNQVNRKSLKPEQNFIKKNRDKLGGTLSRTKDGITKENGGYYTLTHEQLNTILKSVGKIASLHGEGVNIAIEQALALQKRQKDPLTTELKIEDTDTPRTNPETGTERQDNAETEQPGGEDKGDHSDTGLVNKETTQETGRESKVNTDRPTARSESRKSKRRDRKKRTEPATDPAACPDETSQQGREPQAEQEKSSPRFSPPPIPRSHMTRAERRRMEMKLQGDTEERGIVPSITSPPSQKRLTRNPLTNSHADDPTPIKFHIPSPQIPRAHLTMAEKKRLQWEIERGETINTPPSKKAESKQPTENTVTGTSGDTAPVEVVSPRPMPVPPAHLTQAERKRRQWEAERAEQQRQVTFDPWGRPGAGAPIRTNSGHTLADYKTRKDQAVRISLQKDEPHSPGQPSPREAPARREAPAHREAPTEDPSLTFSPRMTAAQGSSLPAAMRSSFAIGYVAPDAERFKSTKEEERRKWLEELEKQKEEKRLQKEREKEKDRAYFAETWADKLTYEAPKKVDKPDYIGAASLSPRGAPATNPQPQTSPRVGSAPQAKTETFSDSNNYTRGAGSFIDPTTQKELDDKKKRHLEHQAAVLAQVEEKQRLKREERERKMREEQEEERKLLQERDRLQRQYDHEQANARRKEAARQERLDELKAAMDQAQFVAQQEKFSKRMQHLQMGGHDIKRLQANIEDGTVEADHPLESTDNQLSANMTPRPTARHVAPVSVPGLDLTPRPWQAPEDLISQAPPQHGAPSQPPPHHRAPSRPPEDDTHRVEQYTQDVTNRSTDVRRYHHEPYTENRILTPSIMRKAANNPLSPLREFGTQTDAVMATEDFQREISEDSITYKENKRPVQNKRMKAKVSDKKDNDLDKRNSKPPIGKKGPLKVNERPKWGTQNPKLKKPVKQSERDPFFERKKKEREERRMKREQELLALVEANKRVIPVSEHRDPSPEDSDRIYYYNEGDNVTSERREKDRSKTRTKRHSDRRHSPSRQSPQRSVTPDEGQGHSREERKVLGAHTTKAPGLSPPVPALRHKLDSWREPKDYENNFDLDSHSYTNYPGRKSRHPEKRHVESHYQDDFPNEIPSEGNDFVPFMRTSEILDPGRAAVPVIVSRENSAVVRARQEYHRGQHPGAHGSQLEYIDDKKYPVVSPTYNDPILNPNVVKGHPTPRQDLILQQLSDLRLNLMQRRREVETYMSPTELAIGREDTGY